jgi:hypothetical protein
VATPRMAAKAGIPKQPPFGKLSAQAKKSGPQPPIPASKPGKPSVGRPTSGRRPPFTKPGSPKAGP